MPLDSKIGGQISHDRPKVGQFLTKEQANYVHEKVETGEMINAATIQQEIEQEEQLNRMDDTNRGNQSILKINCQQCRENRAIDDANGTVVNFKQCPKLFQT